ncbi:MULTISPECIES: hypothetical protein [unclassified Streptomyces]|uniref:hypothetical protein n=1 Tax=unclassified Streptomyces TaxID=2593676 RepID=UPI0033EE9190
MDEPERYADRYDVIIAAERAVGNELAARLTHTVHTLDLANRATPIDRAHDEEENLARLLIAAA